MIILHALRVLPLLNIGKDNTFCIGFLLEVLL